MQEVHWVGLDSQAAQFLSQFKHLPEVISNKLPVPHSISSHYPFWPTLSKMFLHAVHWEALVHLEQFSGHLMHLLAKSSKNDASSEQEHFPLELARDKPSWHLEQVSCPVNNEVSHLSQWGKRIEHGKQLSFSTKVEAGHSKHLFLPKTAGIEQLLHEPFFEHVKQSLSHLMHFPPAATSAKKPFLHMQLPDCCKVAVRLSHSRHKSGPEHRLQLTEHFLQRLFSLYSLAAQTINVSSWHEPSC